MRIWIDLSNSPHPLLFAPIGRAFRDDGHEVLYTFRDHAQTKALTGDLIGEAEEVGTESPASPRRKALSIGARAVALRAWAQRARPDVALSHNSYAQLLAARLARIPAVTAMDYEHQPANHLAFRAAHKILVPACIPRKPLRRTGATDQKLVRYEGFKEEIYLAESDPDARVLADLGIEPDARVAVFRTPPSRAIYHRVENQLLTPIIRRLANTGWNCVVLPRHAEQIAELSALGDPGLIVPSDPVDSRSLLHHAGLFIGAGGTMTREAALLEVPTATVFAGKPAAVDVELERRGAMRRLDRPEAVDNLVRVDRDHSLVLAALRKRASRIRELFVRTTVESVAG